MEHSAADKNLNLNFASLIQPGREECICGDENALTQVFVNLLGNAIKFTRDGGNIEVKLEQKNTGIEISLIDDGIGIPSEDLPLLFTRFFRGSNAISFEIPGTGMGLFIVHQIIEKHNGRIKVRSEVGRGSRFDVWLPVDDIQ
jgi:signal transduction histidine kinase